MYLTLVIPLKTWWPYLKNGPTHQKPVAACVAALGQGRVFAFMLGNLVHHCYYRSVVAAKWFILFQGRRWTVIVTLIVCSLLIVSPLVWVAKKFASDCLGSSKQPCCLPCCCKARAGTLRPETSKLLPHLKQLEWGVRLLGALW